MQLTFSQMQIPRTRKISLNNSLVIDDTAIEKARHSLQMHKYYIYQYQLNPFQNR